MLAVFSSMRLVVAVPELRLAWLGPAGEPRQRYGEQECQGHRGHREPDQRRDDVTEAVVHHVDRNDSAEDRHHRHERDVETDALDRRRVVHGPVDAVADALVVEHGHRQLYQAVEQVGTKGVGYPLHQPDIAQQVRQAPDAARHRPAGADQVFALGGRVLALGQKRQVAPGIAGPGTEQDYEERQERQRGEEQPERIENRHGGDERLEERREADRGFRKRMLEHDVVDENLDRPRHDEERRETAEHQAELEGEQSPMRADVDQAPPQDAKHVGSGEVGANIDDIVVGPPTGPGGVRHGHRPFPQGSRDRRMPGNVRPDSSSALRGCLARRPHRARRRALGGPAGSCGSCG